MAPAKLRTLLEDAVAHHKGGRLREAESLYARVRAVAPANFDALHLSGLAAQQQSRHRDAAGFLRQALRVNPTSAVCEMRLGVAVMALGDAASAEKHLQRAVSRSPELTEAWCHLGTALRAMGRHQAACAAFERAITLDGNCLEAHERLCALVSAVDGFAAAVPLLRRVVALMPESASALANLGIALAQSSCSTEALTCLKKAVDLEPEHPLALTGLALYYQETYRLPEAIATYGRVLGRNPGNHEARSGRLLALHYVDGTGRREMLAEHLAFGDAVAPGKAPAFGNSRDPARRLRVGFLSPDLRAHSVAYFLDPILAHLDPGQFETFLYHDHPRIDGMSARLRSRATAWRHLAGLSGDAVESLIRADAPDILIDLAGHTGLNRLALFARRLAPVQASYLGYPDTTGLLAMDYRLVDHVTDPVGEADGYCAEKLVRFAPTAWAYSPPDSAPIPAPAPGVSGKPVTFGCFNNFAKVSDSTLRGWARILTAVPGSRLLLKGRGLDSPDTAARIMERFAAAGIEGGRVELLGRTTEIAGHLGLYSRVDVALDTYPYHGTTTTCEAMWMGVPVVTLLGARHVSRVGASLVASSGHAEWIARDWDEYVQIAAEVAHDGDTRAALRATLREDMRRGALMDHPGQAARFGAALRECWKTWCGRQS
jgi:protein O-GlcNAc transferase